MCEFIPCFIMKEVRQSTVQQNLLRIKVWLSPVQDNLKPFLSTGSIAFSLYILVLYCGIQNSVTGKVNSSSFDEELKNAHLFFGRSFMMRHDRYIHFILIWECKEK